MVQELQCDVTAAFINQPALKQNTRRQTNAIRSVGCCVNGAQFFSVRKATPPVREARVYLPLCSMRTCLNRQLYEKRGCPDAATRLGASIPNPKVATFYAALWLTFTLPLTPRHECYAIRSLNLLPAFLNFIRIICSKRCVFATSMYESPVIPPESKGLQK